MKLIDVYNEVATDGAKVEIWDGENKVQLSPDLYDRSVSIVYTDHTVTPKLVQIDI